LTSFFEGDGRDGFRVRRLFGNVLPLAEVEGVEGAIVVVEDNLSVTLEDKSQRAPGSANIDGLPQAVQNQNMLIKKAHKG